MPAVPTKPRKSPTVGPGGRGCVGSRRPGAVANRSLVQDIYLHRSCLLLVEVDFGERDVTSGFAQVECEGVCGL